MPSNSKLTPSRRGVVKRYIEIIPGTAFPVYVVEACLRDNRLASVDARNAVFRAADLRCEIPDNPYTIFMLALAKWRDWKYREYGKNTEQAALYDLMSCILDSRIGGREVRVTDKGMHKDAPMTVNLADMLMIVQEMKSCWSMLHLEKVTSWPKLEGEGEGCWFEAWSNWASQSVFVLYDARPAVAAFDWKTDFMRMHTHKAAEDCKDDSDSCAVVNDVPGADAEPVAVSAASEQVQLFTDHDVNDELLGNRKRHSIQALANIEYTMTFNAGSSLLQAIVDELELRTKPFVSSVSVGPLNTCTIVLTDQDALRCVSDLFTVTTQIERLNSLAASIYDDIIKVLETIETVKYRGVYRLEGPAKKI